MTVFVAEFSFSTYPEDIDTSLLLDKRTILVVYRGVDIKTQVHSIIEEIELRGWAKFKSLAAKAGLLVSLWREAISPYSEYPCPWLPLSLGLALLQSSHALHLTLGCGLHYYNRRMHCI